MGGVSPETWPLANLRGLAASGARAWRGTRGGQTGERSLLYRKAVHWCSLSEASQGVWALTGLLPHKSPDLRHSRLPAALSPAPCLFICERQVGVWLLGPSRDHVF